MNEVTYKKARREDIDELFWYWQSTVGYPIKTNITKNRYALHRLIKAYDFDMVQKFIDGVALTYTDQFAPQIADFVQLEYKLQNLLAWGKRRSNDKSETIEL
jgi:hypothetical protein